MMIDKYIHRYATTAQVEIQPMKKQQMEK